MFGTDATINRYNVILTLTSLIIFFQIYMSARFYDLFSDIMTLYVELDFCQNFISYACRTVETEEASKKCYNFSLISDHPLVIIPTVWSLSHSKSLPYLTLLCHGSMDQPQIEKRELSSTLARDLSV